MQPISSLPINHYMSTFLWTSPALPFFLLGILWNKLLALLTIYAFVLLKTIVLVLLSPPTPLSLPPMPLQRFAIDIFLILFTKTICTALIVSHQVLDKCTHPIITEVHSTIIYRPTLQFPYLIDSSICSYIISYFFIFTIDFSITCSGA